MTLRRMSKMSEIPEGPGILKRILAALQVLEADLEKGGGNATGGNGNATGKFGNATGGVAIGNATGSA